MEGRGAYVYCLSMSQMAHWGWTTFPIRRLHQWLSHLKKQNKHVKFRLFAPPERIFQTCKWFNSFIAYPPEKASVPIDVWQKQWNVEKRKHETITLMNRESVEITIVKKGACIAKYGRRHFFSNNAVFIVRWIHFWKTNADGLSHDVKVDIFWCYI